MEIQVGEYVKSTDGFIAKVEEIDEDFIDFDSPIIIGYDGSCSYFGRDQLHFIAKHSFNIIDLIEEGDYVNGIRVEDVYRPEGTYVKYIVINGNHLIGSNDDIKSIVTKEQFKSMEYVIEEG